MFILNIVQPKVPNACFSSVSTSCVNKELITIILMNGLRILIKGLMHGVTIILGVKY